MFRQQLTSLPIFQGFSEQQLRMLDSKMTYCQLQQGTVVFEQGEAAHHLYILTAGEVSIHYKPYDGPALVVARILPGGVFGWSAALGRTAYTSAALVEVDSEAYCIAGDDLRQLCEKCPDTGTIFLERLAEVIAERLRNTHAEIKAILSQAIDVNGNCLRRIHDKR